MATDSPLMMRVCEQAPCLREFWAQRARPAILVAPVRPELRFFSTSLGAGRFGDGFFVVGKIIFDKRCGLVVLRLRLLDFLLVEVHSEFSVRWRRARWLRKMRASCWGNWR